MPNRVTATLLVLFALIAGAFALGVMALTHGRDLEAVGLAVFAILGLRALNEAARHAEGRR